MILGIDPGPNDCAAVSWDGASVEIVGKELTLPELLPILGFFAAGFHKATVAIEDFVVYQPLDTHGRETVKQIGAIRWMCSRRDIPVIEIPRAAILRHIMGATKGGDTALRAAITDRFGGSKRAAWGVNKSPGPLFGLTGSHLLAALAVAITAEETGGNL